MWWMWMLGLIVVVYLAFGWGFAAGVNRPNAAELRQQSVASRVLGWPGMF